MELTPQTTVKTLLMTYPRTFQVFESHGMCESCKTDPPPVPLQHFAMKHCGGDIEGLIQELRAAMA